ncbi:HAMP domain-containing histidine kinase [Lysinibacillus xylanilyticus]|uniref:histidine kinase n=2 Tax=Lysinibacillus xylanilyticus TaxID=582475 RepID=A0ABT4ETK8_9BACI|nr:HAMP domain-containing sensor histidine kinase [Lysinibacillus xylanilyticus]MCY9548858.1 HAMP domain-containing histidine kinase [Lysinibacillus xylanilyticus]
MRITTKINLLTTAWMLCILILVNIAVYFSFTKFTTNMEEVELFQKAEDLIKVIDSLDASSNINEKLGDFLTPHSYIRIIDPNNNVLHEKTNDILLSKTIQGKYAETKQAQTHLISAEQDEEQVLIVRVPIKEGNQITGSIEIGERLLGFETDKDILRAILGLCTLLAAIFSLLGGKWLSNMIMKPISSMIKTMEEIEKSGVPKPIAIQNQTKDELHTMARTFNQMIHRLQENMEKQKQFVSDASHELKTPLTIIMNYADFLRRHGLDNQDMTDEAINAITSEATRMQKMTQTLLDLATLENEISLELKELNLVSLCQSVLNQLKQVYSREISLHYKEDPIVILADELKIKQLIIILLDNAMKYSKDQIDVFIEKDPQHVIICVKDYGIGIPKGELNNIFERFYRVDKARTRRTEGSGLGLSIANRIMKLYKGEIKITSKEGTGTTVELYIPFSKT